MRRDERDHSPLGDTALQSESTVVVTAISTEMGVRDCAGWNP